MQLRKTKLFRLSPCLDPCRQVCKCRSRQGVRDRSPLRICCPRSELPSESSCAGRALRRTRAPDCRACASCTCRETVPAAPSFPPVHHLRRTNKRTSMRERQRRAVYHDSWVDDRVASVAFTVFCKALWYVKSNLWYVKSNAGQQNRVCYKIRVVFSKHRIYTIQHDVMMSSCLL